LHGESKLDSLVAWEYLMLLLDRQFGHFVPVRFVSFAAIGVSASLSTSLHFIVRCRQQIFRLRKAVEQSRQ
jgi:dolichol-phosphate mannosyltransferase